MKSQASLTITTDYSRTDVVITLVGILDDTTVGESRHNLRQLFTAGSRLIVDVALLDECDRTGLALLLNLHCLCRAKGGSLRLVAPPAWWCTILEHADLLDSLAIYPTVEAARQGWLHERLLPGGTPGSVN